MPDYVPRVLDNIREKMVYVEDVKSVWMAYRLMDEESKRITIEAELDQYMPSIHIQAIELKLSEGSGPIPFYLATLSKSLSL